MAGIGFALRRVLSHDSYGASLQAYAYAGIIAAGPWILSIVGILLIGLISTPALGEPEAVSQFQTSVTYLIAGTIILTGPIQLGFTRFVADRVYAGEEERVLPNFHGVLALVAAISGAIGLLVLLAFFGGMAPIYRLLMLTGWVLMSLIWVATLLLSGLRHYHAVVGLYALGYAVSVLSALALRQHGVEGLLTGFLAGQALMLIGMIAMVQRAYPSDNFIAFGFARRGSMFPSLLAVGLFFNCALWIDKFMFWFSADTGQQVLGPLRASPVYDLPIFLAYLSIIPGMAVFLLRMETDFVESYHRFFNAVRDGARLQQIESIRNEMVSHVRRGLFEIIRIQSITALVVFAAGPTLLDWAGIPQLYLPLLYIDVVAAGLQVVLLGVLNVFFYLDKRRTVLILTASLLGVNALLTWVTLQMGAPYYGYGFAGAMLVAVLAGFAALDRRLDSLEYETFMLR
jgi:uncharacterized membrane protein